VRPLGRRGRRSSFDAPWFSPGSAEPVGAAFVPAARSAQRRARSLKREPEERDDEARRSEYKIDPDGRKHLGSAPQPVNKREYGPGQHGQRRKGKATDSHPAQGQAEDQGYYGKSPSASSTSTTRGDADEGDSSANLIGLLERRLDAVIYRAKFVPTVFAARQFVNHGHLKVNGRRVNIASFQVKVATSLMIKESSRQIALVLEAAALAERDVPDYLEVDHGKGTAKMTRVRASLRFLSDPDGAEPGHRVLLR